MRIAPHPSSWPKAVIPAKAGIQTVLATVSELHRIPAHAGMTSIRDPEPVMGLHPVMGAPLWRDYAGGAASFSWVSADMTPGMPWFPAA
jgi:hypothetical protein